MLLSYLFLIVSVIWLASEIILARLKISDRKEQSQKLDRGSFKLLWLVISLSIVGGIVVAILGVGLIRQHARTISLCGIVLIILGLVIRWIAILSLKRYFTVDVSIQKNHQLKTDGIYRHIRHPAYLGSLLSFLGLGIAFSNWLSTIAIFFPILFVFIKRIHIEEKALEDSLGNKYAEYRQNTKRLLPLIY